MAKISIDDRAGKEKIPSEVMNRLLDGACRAIGRLGPAADNIEVIGIKLLKMVEGVPFISIKLVVVPIKDNGRGSSSFRTEEEFSFFFRPETGEDFLSQSVIRNFQEITARLAGQFERKAGDLRSALADLGLCEEESGNSKRCRICGHMPIVGKHGPCPECAKCIG